MIPEFIKAHKIGTSVTAVVIAVVAALCITGFIKRDTIKGYAHSTTVNKLADGQENKGGYVFNTADNTWARNDKGGFIKYTKDVK